MTRLSPSFECHFTTAQDERCFIFGIVDAVSPILSGHQKMVTIARLDYPSIQMAESNSNGGCGRLVESRALTAVMRSNTTETCRIIVALSV